MPKEDEPRLCPHCGQGLSRWKSPPLTSWGNTIHFVCFHDDCPYFVKGRAWMEEKFNVKTSYRYRCDSETEHSGPLPVWSKDALKDGIIDEGSIVDEGSIIDEGSTIDESGESPDR